MSLPRLLHSLSQRQQQKQNIRNEVQLITQLLDSGDVGELQENAAKVAEILCGNRICSLQWISGRPNRRWLMAILRLCRMLFRHSTAVEEFHNGGKYTEYVQFCNYVVSCLESEEDFILCAKFMLNLSSRLAFIHADNLASVRLQRAAIRCLHSNDMLVVQAALELLAVLCDGSDFCRKDLCETAAIDACLHLLPDGDILTQKHCASLLRILCGEEQAQQQLRIYDGVPLLVGLLSIRNSRLKWHVAWCLAQLADDAETANEVAQVGGVGLLLADMASRPPETGINDWVAMLAAECAILAQLCVSDSLQSILVQSNTLFLLGRLLLLAYTQPTVANAPALPTLQCSSFRVLRLIFSVERFRPLFRRVFPTNVLEAFVDVGNYVQDLTSYAKVLVLYQDYLENTPLKDVEVLWETVNQRRRPIGRAGEYELLEQLGAGAFGCVYTARKITASASGQPKLFAVKEIFMVQPRNNENDKSFGDVISEVKIIKQQLRHPNVVRYRRIFEENGRLYVVMDLVEGVPLKDLITSSKERKTPFPEERVWCFLIQLLLGLRYLHKEKSIIHRDLKPSNIMVTEDDRVVITDFGLARQKGPDYLKSAAGTIIYSCPEVVQNEPYGEKADIWSLGCVVYESIVLQPPFQSNNMLKLAKMIVEAEYEPLPANYSEELTSVVTSCLQVNPKDRPDIIELCIGPLVGPRILECLDDALRIHAEARKKEKNNNNPATVVTPVPAMNTPREKVREVIRKVAGPESIDKPRYRKDIKALSAGQQPVRSSSTFSLPRIAGPGSQNSSASGPRVRSSEGLTLRSTVLRPIADPVLGILEQVRRLFAVTSSARGEAVNHRRRLVEQFKKKIFSKEITPEQMKTHFRKLAVESSEEIELDLGFADFSVILEEMGHPEASEHRLRRLTYDQLAACVQSLLTTGEYGY